MLTLPDLARLNRRRYGDDLAVIDADRSLTHAELTERAWAVAAGLRSAGVGPGERVGILADNSSRYVELYVGVACAGAAPVLYNWRWAPPELAYAIADSTPAVVFVDERYASLLDAAMPMTDESACPVIVHEGPEHDEFLGEPAEPDVRPTCDDTNCVIYTNGTTGFPKGVVLTHGQVMTTALNMIIAAGVTKSDRTLLITPMFHSASLLCWFYSHYVAGGSSVVAPRFDVDGTGSLIEQSRATNGFFTCDMMRRMISHGTFTRHDMSSLNKVYVGGSTLRLPDKRSIQKALPGARMYTQYGLTEAAGIITRLGPDEMFSEKTDGSVGKELPLCEIALRDPVTCEEVGDGQPGELWVRGPGVMSGYLGKPEATAEVMAGEWLRTGDLVTRDADGYIFLLDRLKDMIKTGGENVYGAEVERVLFSHSAVVEAAVFGMPSVQWGEEVCAVVSLRDGESVTPDELRQFCRSHLAGYKIPKKLKIVDRSELPINDVGKMLKRKLKTMNFFDA